ncbi:MAG: amino acid permease [Sphingobium sp.]|nr:amino acid permease [Sphingobium sp.]
MMDAPEQGALRRSRTGWLMLAGLGVSYVIGGDFSAWNFGLARAGWGGMVIAVLLAALIWVALILTLAELSSMLPDAGGGALFAHRAFGPLAGRLTGYAIMIEYGAAASVVAIFIDAYFKSLTGLGGWAIIILTFVIPTAIHLRGAKEAIGTVFALTSVAAAGIIVFGIAMAPHFSVRNLFDMAAGSGGSVLLPYGWLGIWAAMPFATAFFLAVEGIAMAAEEVEDPRKILPRAMIAAVAILLGLAIILLLAGPGGAGVSSLVGQNDPLPAALHAVGIGGPVMWVVSIAALVGLGACMFSAIYAFSRQAFALARSGWLPASLARTDSRQVPVRAILIPALVAMIIAMTGEAEGVFVAMVFAAMISYVFMAAAHIRLRRSEPEHERPFRTPGGIIVSGLALLSSLVLLLACIIANPLWSFATGIAMAALVFLSGFRAGDRAA